MVLAEADAMVHGIVIAAMLTLVGDNGGSDQVPAPTQPPSAQPHRPCEEAAYAAFRQSDLAKALGALYGPSFVGPPVECVQRQLPRQQGK
jgi:hypothetical protein